MTGTLEDREAIRDILAAYAHAIDRRRWGMMERLFHPDATFRFGTIEGDWRGFVEQARAVNAAPSTPIVWQPSQPRARKSSNPRTSSSFSASRSPP